LRDYEIEKLMIRPVTFFYGKSLPRLGDDFITADVFQKNNIMVH